MNPNNDKSDLLRLKNMRFYGFHGAYAEEKRLGGQYRVSIEMTGDFSYENTNDEVKRTVDLVEVYRTVEEIVCEKRFNLIETLAEEIAEVILTGFGIEKVTVCVAKEQPPVPGIVQEIEAVITRINQH